ncbi:unnamed protein product, partial [Symbiodinium pilosum]
AKAKTRRQLLEAFVSREDYHRQKHYDFCSKQVLSVYTTFPRPFFSREDFRSCVQAPQVLPAPVAPQEEKASKGSEERAATASVAPAAPTAHVADTAPTAASPAAPSHGAVWSRSPRFPALLPSTKEAATEVQVPSPRKAPDRLQLLKTSPAWSFGCHGVGHRYPGRGVLPRGPRHVDFRSLRASLAFDDTRLLEDPWVPSRD